MSPEKSRNHAEQSNGCIMYMYIYIIHVDTFIVVAAAPPPLSFLNPSIFIVYFYQIDCADYHESGDRKLKSTKSQSN